MSELNDLEAHLGYWMRMVSNQVSHAFSQKLEGRGVTVAEWVVLRRLWDEEEAIPSALAEGLGLTRGAISKLVDRLLQKGLVSRRALEEDKRFQRVALTPAGRALVPELVAVADANDEEFFSVLSVTGRDQLKALLLELVRAHQLSAPPVE